jgi:hypothetical protein
VTINNGMYMTVARANIAARWPERQPTQCYTLQTVSGGVHHHLEESIPDADLGQLPLRIWVFFANIANEFILGLDTLRPYKAPMAMQRQMLCLAEELSLWSPGAGPLICCLVVANDQVIPVQCKEVAMAQFENPLGGEKVLGQPSPDAHTPKARTLF